MQVREFCRAAAKHVFDRSSVQQRAPKFIFETIHAFEGVLNKETILNNPKLGVSHS